MLEKLLNDLQTRYPNKLPIKQVNDFQLGILIGQNNIIEYVATFIDKTKLNSITTTITNS